MLGQFKSLVCSAACAGQGAYWSAPQKTASNAIVPTTAGVVLRAATWQMQGEHSLAGPKNRGQYQGFQPSHLAVQTSGQSESQLISNGLAANGAPWAAGGTPRAGSFEATAGPGFKPFTACEFLALIWKLLMAASTVSSCPVQLIALNIVTFTDLYCSVAALLRTFRAVLCPPSTTDYNFVL